MIGSLPESELASAERREWKMLEGYVESGIGAIVGFALAQLFNGAKMIREWYTRPKLVIESCHENAVLETTEHHTIYGFSVRNSGRGIATGVRVQLLTIVARHEGKKHYRLSENAYDLSPYRRGKSESLSVPLTLVPGAAIEIMLASRNDFKDDAICDDVIYPSVSEIPHLFEEIATGADEYRYTIVAFDDKAHSTQKTLSLQ